MDTIKGKFFIVPNSISSFWSFGGNDGKADLLKSLDPASYWADAGPLEECFDKRFEVKEGDMFMEVWFCSEASDNWVDHGHPQLKAFNMRNLPLRLLKNLKEGDTLTFRFNGIPVELEAAQAEFRYGRFGLFQDIVGMLEAKHNARQAAA